MNLSELTLDRFLYRDDSQDTQTKNAVSTSLNSSPEDPVGIPSGGAAQDINTGNVFINGNQLEPGTIPQTILDVANWGWGQTSTFTSTSATQVNWGSGTFRSAGGDVYAISAGNTGSMSSKRYIYLDLNVSDSSYQVTSVSSDSVGMGKVLIAVAENGATSATFNLNEATQIVGDNILANTIDATKMNVGQLSAISADIGSVTAGTVTGALLRTSSGGTRVELKNDNTLIYYVSGNRRTALVNSGVAFYDASGVLGGTLYSTTAGKLTVISAGNYSFDGNAFFSEWPTQDLGKTGDRWRNLYLSDSAYVQNIRIAPPSSVSYTFVLPNGTGSSGQVLTTNGSGVTSWSTPSTGATTLSALSINTNKNWSAYSITNSGGVTLSGSGRSFNCNGGYIDFAKAIYFVDSGSFIYNNGNVLEYESDTDHDFYINGILRAIIDANFYTAGDIYADGTKFFIMPHPDGSDRLLRYTAQESPEVLLRHRGKATTDSKGKFTIIPPNHFTLVTDPKGDVTVNLTSVGDNRVFLEEEPTNSEIKIQSSNPRVSFHYEIVAVRQGYLNHTVELDNKDKNLSTEDATLLNKLKSIPDKNKKHKEAKISRNNLPKQ